MSKAERLVDQELRSLKGEILEMGLSVEKALSCAVQGLIERELSLLEEVHQHETRINQFQMTIDEACLNVLARQSPMASDLRLVLGCIKINSDLERMGDQATNIAHLSKHYIGEIALKPLIDLPRMAHDVQVMTRDALDAFVRRDQVLARSVVLKDDAVDTHKRKILDDLVQIMKDDPATVDRAMDLILISRNLERVGDHATNIAEDVIFVASGIDIRHGLYRTSS